ncbi:cyclic nucleotide-gated ion channel 1-like [Tripterygium wilfordii]|uniref:Cyclic nucleotide-gated ion channel 1-like n=1 Tax=Tripterygium wilfordii TaxID=458696 RepID=A0A7J7C5I0_TRIWF|nr:cyclic nucleotide-gated ion channel 1-like [Tripterygium wilfordii]
MRSNEGDEEQGRVRSASFNVSQETSEEELSEEETSEEETYVKPVAILSKKIFIVLLVIEVSLLDPLFFYVPVINDQRKCVHIDQKLGTAVSVLRSLIDFFYAIYIIAQVHKYYFVDHSTTDKDEDQYTKLGIFLFLTDFLAVLPLPQVVLLIIPTMRGSKFLNAMCLLRSVVLCQFVPRFFRTYLFITSGTFGDPAEARVKFSPFLYMLGLEVIGAFWYFLSIERLMKCYNKACENIVGCVNSFYCKDNVGDHTSLNDSCRKTEFFNFGIFEDALKSHVMEITDFPKKFFTVSGGVCKILVALVKTLKPAPIPGKTYLQFPRASVACFCF